MLIINGGNVTANDGSGVTTIINGTLAPDGGTLTFDGGLTISSTATLEFSSTADKIAVTDGILSLVGGIMLNLAGAGSYTLFDYTGADLEGAESWNSWNLGEFGGTDYTRAWNNTGNAITLTITPIPEPGTWALMLGGLGILGYLQRARRKA